MKKILFILFFYFFIPFSTLLAQNGKRTITEKDYQNETVEMADQFRADGKIYVVVAVILTILGGMFAYLFLMDKKIKTLEKMLDK